MQTDWRSGQPFPRMHFCRTGIKQRCSATRAFKTTGRAARFRVMYCLRRLTPACTRVLHHFPDATHNLKFCWLGVMTLIGCVYTFAERLYGRSSFHAVRPLCTLCPSSVFRIFYDQTNQIFLMRGLSTSTRIFGICHPSNACRSAGNAERLWPRRSRAGHEGRRQGVWRYKQDHG